MRMTIVLEGNVGWEPVKCGWLQAERNAEWETIADAHAHTQRLESEAP